MIFYREDWTLFRTLATLGQKAGVPKEKLARLVIKELVDNALDAAGDCDFGLRDGTLWVSDQGAGFGGSDAELASWFSIARPLASTKLLRLPTRGAMGNGLRVVAGAVLASGGELRISSGGRTLRLLPQDDGSTRVERLSDWSGVGTKIEVRLGPSIPLDAFTLEWANRSMLFVPGGKSYRGRTSPHWYDTDAFFELAQAAGNRSTAELVGGFERLSRAQALQVAGPLAWREACSLSREEAEDLLLAAREKCRPVPPSRLGAVGRVDALPYPYARSTGTFTVAAARGSVHAEIPYVLEAWAGEHEVPRLYLQINRTPATADMQVFLKKTELHVFGCGLGHRISVGRRPLELYLNVQTPFMPITTDGKEPDLRPLLQPIAKLLGKVAASARRHRSYSHGPATREKDLILDCLPLAVDKASGNGQYRFSQRQLYYAVRPYVIGVTDKEPNYDYFARVLTEYEAYYGDIPGLYRDPRGVLYHPHLGAEIPLGTLAVERYRRPHWTFNKILYSEKEGFFSILRSVQWPERHDCALLTSKGFASRAARDVIDLLGDSQEELLFFCIHDADAHGTLIYQALQDGTLARRGRRVRIINLGLEPAEALAMQLEVEHVQRKKPAPVAEYVEPTWREWLQHSRVELNAMSTPLFLQWLDAKFERHGQGKLVPPPPVLHESLQRDVQQQVRQSLTEAILQQAGLDEQVERTCRSLQPQLEARSQVLEGYVRGELSRNPIGSWKHPLGQLAADIVGDELGP